MQNYVFLGFVWFLRFWLVISPLVFLWLFFDNRRRDYFIKHYAIAYFIVTLGSIVCLCIVLMTGLESLLIFIPMDWGSSNADGEFITTRNTISGMFAVFLTFIFCAVFENRNRFRSENHQHISFMKEKANEIQRELYMLQGQNKNQASDVHEQRERFLNKLHKELEQHASDSD